MYIYKYFMSCMFNMVKVLDYSTVIKVQSIELTKSKIKILYMQLKSKDGWYIIKAILCILLIKRKYC